MNKSSLQPHFNRFASDKNFLNSSQNASQHGGRQEIYSAQGNPRRISAKQRLRGHSSALYTITKGESTKMGTMKAAMGARRNNNITSFVQSQEHGNLMQTIGGTPQGERTLKKNASEFNRFRKGGPHGIGADGRHNVLA